MNLFRKIPVIVPIVMVNAVSIAGQILFWQSHLPWPFILCAGFAIALESVAVYLAYHASLAELAQDSAFKLRIASYAFGFVIGLLNYSHFTNHGHVTAASVGMGLLSASSPWLWAINSRRESRDELKSKGLIDDRAVRLGLRWFFFPATAFRVFRLAVWNGESNPITAIRNWEAAKAAHDAEIKSVSAAQQAEQAEIDKRMTLETATSQADKVRVALRDADESTASGYARWLHERGHAGISAAYIRQVRALDARKEASERRDTIRALPSAGNASLT